MNNFSVRIFNDVRDFRLQIANISELFMSIILIPGKMTLLMVLVLVNEQKKTNTFREQTVKEIHT